MSPFEYVTVLISIILGLGITQILTGIADLVHKSNRVVVYWPHILWILFVLLLHIQEWWLLYELKNYYPWRLPTFLFIMAYPINLFILAKMLFPFSFKGKTIDLKVFYYKSYRKIFIIFSMSAVISIAYNIFILNMAMETQILQLLLLSSFLLIALKKISYEWLHKGLATLVLVIFIISIIIEWNVWLIA